jgi:hypothetical protein
MVPAAMVTEANALKRLILVILIAVGLPSAAYSGVFTGMELRQLCVGTKSDQDLCGIWISGFHSGLGAAQSTAKDARVTCIPNGTTGDQARLVIEKFMAEQPNVLHLGADAVSFIALTRAFPCPSSKKSN